MAQKIFMVTRHLITKYCKYSATWISCFYKTNHTDDILCTSGSDFIAAIVSLWMMQWLNFMCGAISVTLAQNPFCHSNISLYYFIQLYHGRKKKCFLSSTLLLLFHNWVRNLKRDFTGRDFCRFIIKFSEILYLYWVSCGFKYRWKNCRGLSSCSRCLVSKCLSNPDGFTVLAKISRHTIHLGQGSSLTVASVNLYFK